MGELPHGEPHNTHSAAFDLRFNFMKSTPTKTGLTFGGLFVNFFNTFSERNVKRAFRLAVKAGLVGIRGGDHYVVSQEKGKT